jgi:hypothetical protein
MLVFVLFIDASLAETVERNLYHAVVRERCVVRHTTERMGCFACSSHELQQTSTELNEANVRHRSRALELAGIECCRQVVDRGHDVAAPTLTSQARWTVVGELLEQRMSGVKPQPTQFERDEYVARKQINAHSILQSSLQLVAHVDEWQSSNDQLSLPALRR